MKLRYYLRGLGIGMLVAVLVLVLSGNTGGKMSDEEVKQRAMQLGMVEKDTSVLADTAAKEENPEAGQAAEAVKEDQSEVVSEAEVSGTDHISKEQISGGQKEESQPDRTEKPAENTEGEATASDQKPEGNAGEAAASGQKPMGNAEGEATASSQNPAKNAEGEATASSQNPADEALQRAEEVAEQGASAAGNAPDNGVVTFEVKQGDSSVSVARRAEEMGLVESAVEFDRFLCQNGYDRRISPGSYQISAMASQEEIADKITRS